MPIGEPPFYTLLGYQSMWEYEYAQEGRIVENEDIMSTKWIKKYPDTHAISHQICEALQLDPNTVTQITLEFNASDMSPSFVTVTLAPDTTALNEIDWTLLESDTENGRE